MQINTEFIQKYDTSIQEIVRKMLPHLHHDQLQDIKQDVYLKLIDVIDKYDDNKAKPTTWLNKVINNFIIDQIRTAKQDVLNTAISDQEPFNDELTLEQTFAQEDSFNGTTEVLKYKQDLEFYLPAIPQNFAEVFKMKYFYGMSHKEISKELGITEDNSMVTLKRATDELRKLVQSEETLDDTYNGYTLQDMYLTLEPEIMYPFKLRYSNGLTWREISELTGETFETLIQRNKKAKNEIYNRFGFSI